MILKVRRSHGKIAAAHLWAVSGGTLRTCLNLSSHLQSRPPGPGGPVAVIKPLCIFLLEGLLRNLAIAPACCKQRAGRL
ncbi:hypothetical protein BV20DRAFT_974453 [Pilatotrama ljubarskyi]|nr:hypothetical protein BV20DRAFT_974453 [Pilatotrama ljubarskyi]